MHYLCTVLKNHKYKCIKHLIETGNDFVVVESRFGDGLEVRWKAECWVKDDTQVRGWSDETAINTDKGIFNLPELWLVLGPQL